MVTPVFVHIGAVDLFDLLWRTLEPKWKKESKGFQLDPQTGLELYDKNYCLITPPQPPKPNNLAISSFFFVKSGKKGDRKFKTGTTSVYLCMTHEVYNKWQDYCHEAEYGDHRPLTQLENVSCQCFCKWYYSSNPSHDVQPFEIALSKTGTRTSKRTKAVGHLLNFQYRTFFMWCLLG